MIQYFRLHRSDDNASPGPDQDQVPTPEQQYARSATILRSQRLCKEDVPTRGPIFILEGIAATNPRRNTKEGVEILYI